MAKLGVNVRGYDFRHFVHCFISMAKSHNIPEYDEAVEEIIDQIKEIVIGT